MPTRTAAVEVLARRRRARELAAQGAGPADVGVELNCSPAIARAVLHAAADSRTPQLTEEAWLAGLPYHAARLLLREGYRSRAGVHAAIRLGQLHPAKTVDLGHASWKAILLWAGHPKPPPTSTTADLEKARRLLESAGYKVVPPILEEARQ